jgi:outer membrane protein assembly factor BamB
MRYSLAPTLFPIMLAVLMAGCRPSEPVAVSPVEEPVIERPVADNGGDGPTDEHPAPIHPTDGRTTDILVDPPMAVAEGPWGAVIAATETTWPLARGDQQGTGVARTTLPDAPEMLWRFSVEKGSFESTPAIVDGVVYVGEMNEKLFALKLESGEKIWEVEGPLGFPGAPAVRNGKVYVGDGEGTFYCLAASDGSELWRYATEAEIIAGANFWRDKVVVGSQDARLYCLDAASGEEVWKLQIENQIRSFSSVVEDRCFVMQCDGTLHIVDLNDGSIVDSVLIGQANTTSSPAVLGDRVLFGTEDGSVVSVNWRKAEIDWSVEDKRPLPYRSSPAVMEGMVVIGSRGRRVQALTPDDGAPLWSFPTRQPVEGSPVIAGERVVIGATDGRLYMLDRTSGKEVWQYECEGKILGGAALADGKFVVGTNRGWVYCFGKK